MSTENFDSERLKADVNATVPEAESALQSATRLDALQFGEVRAGAQTARAEDYQPTYRDPLIGQTHRNFRLIKSLGHGGMGKVYLAERADGVINQRVAIKMMHGDVAESTDLVRRFRTEREILAALKHPNIAQMIDGGSWSDGSLFLAMEYIEGQQIDVWCAEQPAKLETRIRLMIQVCAAVQAAHSALIVHRDLKPANILVDSTDTPKLLDFGIAKVLGDKGFRHTLAVTGNHASPMTLYYASPEQVNAQPVSTASDIYSLGVVLYELLTGSSPYPDSTSANASLINAICNTDPQPPSRTSKADCHDPMLLRLHLHAERIGPDLDAIVLKTLRKQPSERYSSVEALRDDLERSLDGRPVLAHRGNTWFRARKFVRRNFIYVSATAIVLLAVSTAALNWKLQRDAVVLERDKAREATKFLSQVFEQANPLNNRGVVPDIVSVTKHGVSALISNQSIAPEARAEMLVLLSKVLTGLGEYPAALEAAEQTLKGASAWQSANPLLAIQARIAKADALIENDQLELARTELNLLSAFTNSASLNADTLALQRDILLSRGKLEREQRHYDSALVALDQATAKSLLLLSVPSLNAAFHNAKIGANEQKLGAILHEQCRTLSDKGPSSQALAPCTQAQKYREQVFPLDHPGQVVTLDIIGLTLQNLGDLPGALELSEKVRRLTERVFGPDHPTTGKALLNLGVDQRAMGLYPQAQASYEAAARIFTSVRGPNHPHTLLVQNNLANLFYSMGDFERALKLHLEVQEKRRISLPKDSPQHYQSAANIAKCLWRLNRLNQAQSLVESLIAQATATDGKAPRMERLLYARILQGQGKSADAYALAHALRLEIAAQAPDLSNLAGAWLVEAQAALALGHSSVEVNQAAQAALASLKTDESRDLASEAEISAFAQRHR